MAAGRFPTGLRPNDPSRPRARFHAGLTGPTLPVVPPAWAPPTGGWPMDDNDVWGDCVVAGVDHLLQACAEYFGMPRDNWTEEQILSYYRTQNPTFDPASKRYGPGSAADGGMNIQEFLEHLVADGTIVAFGQVDHTNLAELDAATYVGLSTLTGVTVADSQMGQQFDDRRWDYDPSGTPEGGHCIPLVGKPSNLACVTWGTVVQLTGTFIQEQMTEAWFVLTNGHIAHPGFREAYDLKAFAAAVNALTHGKLVVPVPPPAPAPDPVPAPNLPDASFPVAGDLVTHIAAAAFRGRVTPVKWLDHRLRQYFHLKPSIGAHPDYTHSAEVERDERHAGLTEHLQAEIDRLAAFIIDTVPGEPSQSEGAVDTAIRVIKGLQASLELAHLARIEAQNPGIDMDEVVRSRARAVADGK